MTRDHRRRGVFRRVYPRGVGVFTSWLMRKKIIDTGFCIVDIPRTSCTSARGELYARFGYPYGKAFRISGKINKKLQLGGHTEAVRLRQWLGPEAWRQIFTFSIVRNPWERYLSLYFWFINNTHVHGISYFRDLHLRYTREYGRGIPPPTSDVRKDFKHCLLTQYKSGYPWFSANKMLCDQQGNLLVDFVVKFENRQEGLAHVGERIGFPEFGKSSKTNVSVEEYGYREYYDDELRDKVAEVSRWEIQRFDYSFD